MPREAAIIEAGGVRLRPILMTSVAIIAGMMPVAIGSGEGADFRAPLGRAVIGGVITSTLLTLLVIPTFYAMLADGRDRVRERLRQRRRGHRLRHAVGGGRSSQVHFWEWLGCRKPRRFGLPNVELVNSCPLLPAPYYWIVRRYSRGLWPVQRRNARLNALGSEKPRR